MNEGRKLVLLNILRTGAVHLRDVAWKQTIGLFIWLFTIWAPCECRGGSFQALIQSSLQTYKSARVKSFRYI